MKKISFIKLWILVSGFVFSCGSIQAQTNEFTYQGKLTDTGTPSTIYDFEFRLCASDIGDCAIPPPMGVLLETKQRLGVSVSNSIFTVRLDFSAANFTGADRFLEIRVRRNSGEAWTTLNPRQKITSAPYSIKSLLADDSLMLGGMAANQFVLTGDSRLSDARNPLPNSPNYIQNSTSPQTSSNFNISGNGTLGGTLSANVVNAATQYNLSGLRIFSVSGAFNDGSTNYNAINTFIGEGAGINTIPNSSPTNLIGKFNSFYGAGAGQTNVGGANNAFFGALSGLMNNGGNANSFFGSEAGRNNTDGLLNTFIGSQAGYNNKAQSTNTFIGAGADFNSLNPIGNGNTLLGMGAKVNSGVNNGTAIGGRALATQSNSLILGSINGVNNASADTNVGIGTTAPTERLHVAGNGLFTGNLTVNGTLNANLPISENYIRNNPPTQQTANFNINGNGIIGGNVGIGTTTPTERLNVAGNALLTGNLMFRTAFFPGLYSGLSSEANNTLLNFGINNGRQGTFDESRAGYWIRTDTRPGFQGIQFFKKAALSGTESQLMTINEFGKVGIGTPSPTGNLHINVPSSGSPIGAMTVDVQSFQTTANAQASHYFKVSDVGSGGGAAFLVRGDGNVGIGTATPTEKLSVAGNATFTGTISGDGSGLTNLGTNNLAGVPASPGSGVPFIIRAIITGQTSVTIYENTTSPAPRNFMIIDVWSVNTATNGGGTDISWWLYKNANCSVPIAWVISDTDSNTGGQIGKVNRVRTFYDRLFTASTDDLVICGGHQLEVFILALPL